MNWNHIGQGVNDVLCIALVVRLSAFRLHRVYSAFCAFLCVQLVASLIDLIEANLAQGQYPDYRITWIPLQLALWALSLGMVYGLLRGVLSGLPGILKFSRKLLNAIFIVALCIALWSARAEYSVSKALSFVTPLGRTVGLMFVLNRAICTAALIALFAILCFILWFPVVMPKNLAVFSVGFSVYFSATATSWLTWSLGANTSLDVVDDIVMVILSLCYIYWLIFITPEGETQPVRMGHSWHLAEQQKLMGQLESLNASLLRVSRHDPSPLIPSTPPR